MNYGRIQLRAKEDPHPDSNTPILHYSSTPILRYSNTAVLQPSGTPFKDWTPVFTATPDSGFRRNDIFYEISTFCEVILGIDSPFSDSMNWTPITST
jgi:hypothetical protein